MIIAFPNSAIKLELIGYVLLAISLGWSFLHNDLINMSSNSDWIILNEKLNNLWHYNRNLQSFIHDGDFDEINEKYYSLTKNMHYLEESSQMLKKQEKTANILSSILLVLSTLFIACGRGKELIIDLNETKKKKSRM